ncbi:hypothetical protein B5C09_08450 [Staphylococcus delphini]|nr:hypothetical protein B5C09_08450 [Staphylococcus delphini]PCF72805.1 hypothetical protein B4W71_08260 [Staphylococcus delphini]
MDYSEVISNRRASDNGISGSFVKGMAFTSESRAYGCLFIIIYAHFYNKFFECNMNKLGLGIFSI